MKAKKGRPQIKTTEKIVRVHTYCKAKNAELLKILIDKIANKYK